MPVSSPTSRPSSREMPTGAVFSVRPLATSLPSPDIVAAPPLPMPPSSSAKSILMLGSPGANSSFPATHGATLTSLGGCQPNSGQAKQHVHLA
jgi:hypothetical protein